MDECSPPRKLARKSAAVQDTSNNHQDNDEDPPCVFADLPDNCLAAILENLPTVQDRMAAGLVCRRWLYIEHSFRQRYTLLFGEKLAKVAQTFPSTTYLDVARCQFKHGGITDEGLKAVGANCKSLEVLDIGLHDAGLIAVGEYCNVLQYIDFSFCTGIGNDGVAGLADGCCLIYGLTGCTNVTDDGWKHLGNLILATTLKLDRNPHLGHQALLAIAQGCNSLSTLSLDECTSVDGASLEAFSTDRLFSTRYASVEPVPRGLQQCELAGLEALEVLSLSGCTNVTDYTLRSIGTHCRGLQSMSLSGCLQLDDIGLGFIARGCAVLHTIELNDCPTTDLGIQLMVHSCNILTELQLVRCNLITDRSLFAIGNGCTLLVTLDCSYCDRITDEGLKALAAGCVLLEDIVVDNCPNITDEGLGALGEGCPSLRLVDVSNCTRITGKLQLAVMF
eukprot:jgi/Chlat1/7295/Chrsp58S06928